MYLIRMLSSWFMAFSIELELVCIGLGNELRFKLIRGHTPKLCLINLIPWLVVGQPGELGRSVPLGQALMLYQCQCYAQHSCVAEEMVVSMAVGVGTSSVSQGCFQGESICFCPVLHFQLWLSAPEHQQERRRFLSLLTLSYLRGKEGDKFPLGLAHSLLTRL